MNATKKASRVLCAWLFFAWGSASAQEERGVDDQEVALAELTLEEVLQSAREHHPSIAAALANEEGAAAGLLAARGGFDPTLDVRIKARTGYYELLRASATLRQPTPFLGAEIFAGYRYGRGRDERFPSYYSDQTGSGGELRAGVRVPLLRDRAMDSRRASRARAEAGVEGASASRFSTELDIQRDATSAYFGWIAAVSADRLTRELRRLAAERLSFVTARVEAGAAPAIDRLEAERAVLSRDASLVSVNRAVERASLKLALFHRDENGRPILADPRTAPAQMPRPPALEEDDLRALATCHPRARAAEMRARAALIDEELAAAQNAPRLDVTAAVSGDLGDQPDSLQGLVIEGQVVLQVPLLMRRGRGGEARARERRRAAQAAQELVTDRLIVAVQDARSAYEAAEGALAIAEAQVTNARALAVAERERFEAGATTLFFVNQRETALLQSSINLVSAGHALWSAAAAHQAASGCSP